MKNTRLLSSLIALSILLSLSGCNDDEEGLMVQNHDDSELMKIMHSMHAEMDAMQMTGDADHDFASMMIIHHQGAIDMANHLLQKGDDEMMRSMSEHVISEQQAEQQELTDFLEGHTSEPSTMGQEYNDEVMKSMEKSKNLKDIVVLTGDADQDLLNS